MNRSPRLARRAMVKLIAAAAGAPALLAACSATPRGADAPQHAGPAWKGPAGTLSDPDLVHPVVPWKLTLDAEQRATLAVLCALILPADGRSPSAADLGAPAFIDEWVSAPWERMQADAALVREGIAWLDAEAARLHVGNFRALDEAQQAAICDTICDVAAAAPERARAALFFDRVRELTVIAHFTTREGMADLGYVGNVALEEWTAPPAEVLRKLGLE